MVVDLWCNVMTATIEMVMVVHQIVWFNLVTYAVVAVRYQLMFVNKATQLVKQCQ